MPTAAFLTLICLGLLLLSAIYHIALSLFSPSRLFFTFIGFSLACIAFSLIQTFHVLDPSSLRWIVGVQISYTVIVLLNPLLLTVMLEPGVKTRWFLRILFYGNAALFLLIVFAARIQPELVSARVGSKGLIIGPIQYFRAIAGMVNWASGLVVIFLTLSQRSRFRDKRYLFLGYVFMAVGSLFDAVLILNISERGSLLLGFYPGLLSGIILYNVFITLSISRRYRDKKVE